MLVQTTVKIVKYLISMNNYSIKASEVAKFLQICLKKFCEFAPSQFELKTITSDKRRHSKTKTKAYILNNISINPDFSFGK